MVLYNVPFFIVAIIIGYFLNKAFNYFLIGSYKLLIFEEGQFIFNDIIFKAKNAQSISFMVHAIAKYGKLVINYMWLSIFFVFYTSKKNVVYTKPIFK